MTDPAAIAREAAAKAPPLPEANAGPTDEIWAAYFAAHRPAPHLVARHVEKLLQQKQHPHVIALVQAALINGQSQPWMYEILALSMEAEKYPKPAIDRVVLSLADFGTADFGMITYSAAYLVRLGRDEAALRMYREASRMLPEQSEPYILGLRLALKLKDPQGVEWAACGVLRYAWGKDRQTLHREADLAVAEAEGWLKKGGQTDQAASLMSAVREARRRDLVIRLQWSGPGDLDLLVEDPSSSVCSFENPETRGGGMLVHDGYGPRPENTYEEYVCPLGMSGDYRIRVRHAWGEIVGNRATLTIIRHQGSAEEQVTSQSITLGAEEPIVRVTLAFGRRESPRTLTAMDEPRRLADHSPALRRLPREFPDKIKQVVDEFTDSRAERDRVQVQRAGAFFVQPVVTVIPEGASLSVLPVVSPDRRYVRLGVAPSFTNITDVYTFGFLNAPTVGPGGNPGIGR